VQGDQRLTGRLAGSIWNRRDPGSSFQADQIIHSSRPSWDGRVELDLIGENVFRIEGSAEEPDPERAPPTPNDLASARRRPRHESNIKQAANFHGPVDRYLRATLREILDPAFEIGRPVTWSDPRRLMAAPANLLTPQFELRPCQLVHAGMFNRQRVKFGSPGCVALYLWSGYMPGSTIATQASRSI